MVEALAPQRPQFVYGGGRLGLMGTLAEAALARGLEVVGVLPVVFDRPDVVHRGLTENLIVPDLFERKRIMIQRSDAFVVFPGGIGTLDEALEVMCLRQIGQIDKPIIFYNPFSYWDTFLAFQDEMAQQGMVSAAMADLIEVVPDAERLADILARRMSRRV
jgi:uncharacterized protein (TIGR00730 family)